MMEFSVINDAGMESRRIEVKESLFGRPYNGALVHQLVTAYQANGRAGTRAQKTRGQVHYSTQKPWRQKGTGRARAGMRSSPIWRGGGRTFPASPIDNFRRKVNRKMFRGGMAMILSRLVAEKRLVVAESLELTESKTKAAVVRMAAMGLAGRVLFVDSETDANLERAARNLPTANAVTISQLGPTQLIRYDRVVFAERAVRRAEEIWA